MLGSMIEEDDIVLAKDSDGKEKLVVGSYDDDYRWSFDEGGHPGVLFTWHRNVSLGDKPLSRYPEDCLAVYLDNNYSRRYMESDEDYLKRLKEVWEIILTRVEHIEIVDQAEYCDKYDSCDSDDPMSSYYVIDVDKRGGINWSYWIEHNEPEDFTLKDAEVFFDVIHSMSLQQLETLLEYIPDIAFYKLYMFDHSGYVFSLEPFGDPWDSGTLGCFLCTKQEWNTKEPDWKEDYENYLKGAVHELNQIQRGLCWYFVVADVEELIEQAREDVNLRHKAVSDITDAKSLCEYMATGFVPIASGLRKSIKYYGDGCCGGYLADSFDEALEDFLSDQGLKFVSVIED